MELEFDKEIDAILRRARSGNGLDLTAAASPHLDADTIAAFAENALPEKAKLLYMEHFAACDRCRRMLSQSIVLNNEAVTAVAEAASESVTDTVTESAAPWYERLFRSPNLALVMGALVLAFSGVLGYIVLQSRIETMAPEVSRTVDQQPVQGGPYYGGEADQLDTNKAMPPSAVAANTMSTASNSTAAFNAAANSVANAVGRTDMRGGKAVASRDESATAAAEDPKPISAALPELTAGQPAPTVRDNRPDEEKRKAEDKDAMLADRSEAREDRLAREAVPPAAKKSGALRSGPANVQMNTQKQNVFNDSLTRSVGGRTFDRRDGVWYDLAYRGQATRNVRRGSDAYKKLDGGLRSIGDTLDGVVVIVWKENAYRIQ